MTKQVTETVPANSPSDSRANAQADVLLSDAEQEKQPLAVIGIGASAGGLDALERFFSNVPEHSGMAYVVVQHLSPTFKSLMHELLARHTNVPIYRVEDSMAVEPDQIYLIPPGQNMILSNGHLLLNDQDSDAGLQLPIDIFFRSLAYDCGARAVAVVLSGTGSDGSRGIMDVSHSEGTVVVQSPDSAGFDGMPRNALAKDVVDVVAAPEEMPQLIAERLGAGAPSPASEPLEEDAYVRALSTDGKDYSHEASLVALYSLLRRRYQVDFSLYKSPTIMRRIERRMKSVNAISLPDYVDLLVDDNEEQEILYRDFLVEVTEFFRNPAAFYCLEASILTLLRNAEPGETVRAWVAGCATGEEAYSIAILFDRCRRQLMAEESGLLPSIDAQSEAGAAQSLPASPKPTGEEGGSLIGRALDDEALDGGAPDGGAPDDGAPDDGAPDDGAPDDRTVVLKGSANNHDDDDDNGGGHDHDNNNEHLSNWIDIQIFATDVHQGSLAVAARGVYSDIALKALSPSDLERYFDVQDGLYFVRKELRQMVVFAPHNVLDDPPFTRLQLVTCRNLLIYLNAHSQEKVLSRFHFGLRAGGLLFLGSSEHLAPTMAQDFRTINSQWRIYRKESDSARFYAPPPAVATQFRPVIAERRLDRNRMVARNDLYETLLESIMPPSLLLDHNYTILHIFGSAGDYLNLAGEASLNVLDMVSSTLAIALRSGLQRASADMQTITYSDLLPVPKSGGEERVQLRIQPISSSDKRSLSFLIAFVPIATTIDMSEQAPESKLPDPDAGEPHKFVLDQAVSDPSVSDQEVSDPAALDEGALEEGDAAVTQGGDSWHKDKDETVHRFSPIIVRDDRAIDFVPSEEATSQINQLELELTHTREYLHTAVEELETTNEELQSANEELIASNEELQSTNEELQSVNEELHTVNLEHQQKILELQQLNADIRNLQRSTRMVVLFLDMDRNIRSCSDTAADIFGLLPQDIGRPLKQLYLNIGIMPEELDELALQVLEAGDAQQHEVIVDNYPHVMRILPYITQSESVDGVVIVFYDVSEVKAAEAEQAKSEARFQTLVDSASDAIIVCNPQGEILEANAEASENLQYPNKELLSRNMKDIERLWSLDGFVEQLRDELDLKRRFSYNGVLVRKDGTDVPTENHVAKLVYQDAPAFLLLCRDVTHRRESERSIHRLNTELSERAEMLHHANERLSASNSELDRFVQIAAHDLKEPLRGLEHYAHMLENLEHLRDDDEVMPYVSSIRRLSHRLSQLINDLRIYGRIDANDAELDTIDLGHAITLAQENLQTQIEQENATITVEEPLPTIEYFEHYAVLIFQNLISNAIKYNDNNDKRIAISAESVQGFSGPLPDGLEKRDLPNGTMIVSVRDNGIGIPERHQQKIFDMFKRLHVQDAYGGGTGAGLALVKKVVELSGGSIWLTSEPGQGTTFYLML